MPAQAQTNRNPEPRRPLSEWWPEFNQALRERHFPEAGFGIARGYWSEGHTVAQAIEREVAVLERMQAA